MRRLTSHIAATVVLAVPVGAAAQQTVDVIPLSEWDYEQFYGTTWSAEELIDDAEVYGLEGDEIGDVENIIVGQDGRIHSLIIEVGGFWDIGDTHVNVPVDQVRLANGLDRVIVPVSEENVEDYSLVGEYSYLTSLEAGQTQVVEDELRTGPRLWRATELIDDYVRLQAGQPFGYVDDLLFTMDGELAAVVVSPDVTFGFEGPYAVPYYGYAYGWEPGMEYYQLPYGEADLAELEPIDRGVWE